MITVENDNEPIINEQPFSSHTSENQLELLHDFHTKPIRKNVPVTQEENEMNTVIKREKD